MNLEKLLLEKVAEYKREYKCEVANLQLVWGSDASIYGLSEMETVLACIAEWSADGAAVDVWVQVYKDQDAYKADEMEFEDIIYTVNEEKEV